MAWLSVFVSLITLLAVCRITRIVTEDTITQPVRDWIAMKAQPRHARPRTRPPGRAADRPDGSVAPAPLPWRWLHKLVTCPWCSGFWISAAVVLAYFRCWLGHWPHSTPTWFLYAAAVFACSWVSALLADWLDSPPPPKHLHLSGAVDTSGPPPAPTP